MMNDIVSHLTERINLNEKLCQETIQNLKSLNEESFVKVSESLVPPPINEEVNKLKIYCD